MHPKISLAEYQKRRKKFFDQLTENSIAIIFGAPLRHKSADQYYSYQPNNNLYYLTGYSEAEVVAVFIREANNNKFILFNLPNNPLEEKWHGERTGQKGAQEKFGADEAFDIARLKEKLSEWIISKTELFYTFGYDEAADNLIIEIFRQLKKKTRQGVVLPQKIIDVENIIHEMRLIKSKEEIAVLRYAAEVTVMAHKAAMKLCKPNLYEYEIHACIMNTFFSHACQGSAYPNIVAGGSRGNILHYTENNRLLQQNELLLLDAGAAYEFYSADVTCTYPVSGKFSPQQKAIYDLVLLAHDTALALIKPGIAWHKMQEKIIRVLTQGLIDLEILQGNLEQLIQSQAVLPFYMHGSGHWLGLDTHDVSAYKINQDWRLLEAGMVLTVEPGLYFSKAISGLAPQWHDIAVRIEDDVLVTETGYEILSAGLPRTTEEIETFMAS